MDTFDSWCDTINKSLIWKKGKSPFKEVVQQCNKIIENLVSIGISNEDAENDVGCAMQVVCRRAIADKTDHNDIAQFIDLSIEIVNECHFVGNELPFLLFEDLFETHPVNEYRRIWDMLEERTESLANQHMMPYEKITKSKMCMLRIANYLLRRLSASHHTVLCGRVMMFLAYSFPLYERSGVNLLSAFNEDNTTEIEDQATFDNVVASNPAIAEKALKIDEPLIDYTLYSRFWELQKFFVVKPEKGCVSSTERWQSFLRVAEVVLRAFESKPFSQADLDREMQKKRRCTVMFSSSMEVDSDEANRESFYPTKFLSSSRLLRLQLGDPVFRRNVLVQFMFLFRYLENSSAKNILRTVQLSDSSLDIALFQKRVSTLLLKTPPDGATFLRDIEDILQEESGWCLWKSEKCPNFERAPDIEALPDADDDRVPTKQEATVAKLLEERSQLWTPSENDWTTDLLKKESCTNPVFSEFIKDMEVAMDPENCIDDDYHPRNDDVYCWRGLRLLSRDNVVVMSKVIDGSLENACWIRAGKEIPTATASNIEDTKMEEEKPQVEETVSEEKSSMEVDQE